MLLPRVYKNPRRLSSWAVSLPRFVPTTRIAFFPFIHITILSLPSRHPSRDGLRSVRCTKTGSSTQTIYPKNHFHIISKTKQKKPGMDSPRRNSTSHLHLCAMSSSPKSTPTLPPLSCPVTADRCRPLVNPGVYICKDNNKSVRSRRHSWFVDGKLVEMPCDDNNNTYFCRNPTERAIAQPLRRSAGMNGLPAPIYSQADTEISSRRGRSTVPRSTFIGKDNNIQ